MAAFLEGGYNMETGIYIHVPFCKRKCPYCDFYSVIGKNDEMQLYADRIIEDIQGRCGDIPRVASIYFGGGTPNLLGGKNIGRIISALPCHGDAEITVECNPESLEPGDMEAMAAAGVNRISMGVQSCDEGERRRIGRVHTNDEVRSCVEMCREYGIDNISLDFMVGLPGQTEKSIEKTMDFVAELGVPHLSSYMLSIERNTPFGKNPPVLPGEDETVDMFDISRRRLKELGYVHYEISNFAKPGYESRHNCLYWKCKEYLGFGPSAHSFYNGKRYYFDGDLQGYLPGELTPIYDGDGGGFDERVMLGLRLIEGVDLEELGREFPEETQKLIATAHGDEFENLAVIDDGRLRLTEDGFMISNTVIGNLL